MTQQHEAISEEEPEKSPKETAVSVLKNLLGIVAVIAVAAIILSVLHIGCPIKFATGLSCPGCGMFRAWMAFFALHPLEALAYHPLFWCVPIAIVAVVLLQEGKWKRASTAIVVVLLVLICALWLVRLFAFPDTAWIESANSGAQLPEDIVGWETPRWLQWFTGSFLS